MIKRTRGNKTGVIIPLFTRTLHEDGTTSVEPFTPSSDDAVVVTLEAARKYNYTPIIGENCVIFDLSGAEVAGVYSLTVNISRADGSRLRYFTREALELTELSSESGDDETAEFTVTGVELDAAWFFFAKGDTGNGIASVEKTASSGLVDTYTITYTDGTTSTFSVTNGAAGADGRGISNIKKISSVENIDTYRINYTDGSFSLFNVTNGENGAPGRGIVNIIKDSSEGLVDTYEITYTDGTSDFFEVTNGEPGTPGEPGATGNGIVKIEKTATVGLVDTYTIYYTNGTTSTFSVTNGQSGAGGLQRVELETNGDDIHVKGTTTPLTFAEVLALVEDTTKFVTLYDGFNLFLPVYDDEGGAVIFSSAYIQNSRPQITRVAINNAGQIKYETAFMEYANLKTDNLNNEGSEQWRTYPTTHAVNAALNGKVNASDIVQTTGNSTTKVMSQKGVTEAINKPIESNTDAVVTLSATKVLDLGSRGAFEVTISNADATAEYEFTFVGGSGVSVTFPSGIDLGGFAPSEGKKYDCIIYNSKLYYYEW